MPSGRKILTAAEKEERRNLKAKEKALENQRLIAAGSMYWFTSSHPTSPWLFQMTSADRKRKPTRIRVFSQVSSATASDSAPLSVWTKGKVDEQNAYDANKGRKRASSTVQSSEKTKKPKQCQPQVEQERLCEF
jgi:hypothetical protein